MPKIFDNIENQLFEGLSYTLDVSHKADFCVGYFNLRGWKQVADKINSWTGGEGHQCRLLLGMQRRPEKLMRELFSNKEQELIDNNTAIKLRKMLAQEFKGQLTIGLPTEADEIGLRKLSVQIKSKKVVVKLFLRHPLRDSVRRCGMPSLKRKSAKSPISMAACSILIRSSRRTKPLPSRTKLSSACLIFSRSTTGISTRA